MIAGGRVPTGPTDAGAVALLALVLAALAGPAPRPAYAQQDAPGKAVYDRWCAGCHGQSGRGDGPAAAHMLPRPRDFTQALYQIRSTASGSLPLDSDILRIILEGMPATAMPGWKTRLSESERQALVQYLKSFSAFFTSLPAPEPLVFGRPRRATPEALAEGRMFYDSIECWKCHGREGRADGASAPTLRDDAELPIRPADLTENWRFNGGGTAADIYRRLRTGLDGTPMPSNSDLIASGFMTEQQLWNVALYVRSLSPEEPPPVREVVRAALVQGELPTSPDDSAWAAVERFYIPLVGQIIQKPRWFAPTVAGVWVQALHNGDQLALRLAWHDPSRSPDSTWTQWQAAVLAAMEPKEGDSVGMDPRPDAIAVQFPRRVPEGMERPYFLMGDARAPVYLWYWRSAPEAPVEALARGLGNVEPLAGEASALTASATFENGEWRLVLRRRLATADTVNRLQFPVGTAVPIAFFAWDGDNGEEGERGAISTWYYLYLDSSTPVAVYVAPVVAILLSAGLGVLVVARAQRHEKRESGET